MNYTDINAKTWDRWAEDGSAWTQPISHEEYIKVNKDNFIVYLTPCVAVPHEWFGDLCGKKLLGLASGGGQQMPVFAKLGAECTLLDYSDRQLGSDRMVADREGYQIEIVKADMTKRLPFEDESFDIIFHPVSNCYIEDVQHVWNECYRVLKPGGVLLAGMDNGMNFLFASDEEPLVVVNRLPYNPLKLPKEEFERISAEDGVQFSHTLEEQIGGQLKAGFILRALYEDRDRAGCGVIREYAPQYYATMAVKGMMLPERHIYIENDRIALAEYLDAEDDRACYDCWRDEETEAGYNFRMTDTFEEFAASPKRSRFLAVIVRKSDGAVVGVVFVSPPHVLPDLAIMIYRPFREQGIGTAAFALAADYCFQVLGLTELYAGCYEGNVRSRKLLAACGFVPHPEGNCDETHYLTGETIIQYDYVKRQ